MRQHYNKPNIYQDDNNIIKIYFDIIDPLIDKLNSQAPYIISSSKEKFTLTTQREDAIEKLVSLFSPAEVEKVIEKIVQIKKEVLEAKTSYLNALQNQNEDPAEVEISEFVYNMVEEAFHDTSALSETLTADLKLVFADTISKLKQIKQKEVEAELNAILAIHKAQIAIKTALQQLDNVLPQESIDDLTEALSSVKYH